MKRDWDLIRDILIEVETRSDNDRNGLQYKTDPKKSDSENAKAAHAILLAKSGFLDGIESNTLDGTRRLLAPDLTWQGHELLDTIRSKPIWEKVKSTAEEKGIELTFDAVIALGKAALVAVISGAA